jgi:hypothetical protein
MRAAQKGIVISEMSGTASISLDCPHCWVSISRAADCGVPEEHTRFQDFYQGYKFLRAQYHSKSKTKQ